jgi:hypothetical protein
MSRTFLYNNRLTLIVAFVALLLFSLIAVWVSSSDSVASRSPANPLVIGVAYPRNYQQDYTRYASVQRPDGTIRELYVNPVGLEAIQSNRVFPSGTVIVIEGYDALKDSDGNYLVDANGRYLKGESMPFIHVREKRVYGTADDFTSGARNGAWNFGSFDAKTGAVYKESLNACFLCHNTAPQDFTYSYQPIRDFAQTGQAVYFFCRTTGRTACE